MSESEPLSHSETSSRPTDFENPPPTMLAYEYGGRVRWYRLCGYESYTDERRYMEQSGERIVDVAAKEGLDA